MDAKDVTFKVSVGLKIVGRHKLAGGLHRTTFSTKIRTLLGESYSLYRNNPKHGCLQNNETL